jgi:hypothetical protein
MEPTPVRTIINNIGARSSSDLINRGDNVEALPMYSFVHTPPQRDLFIVRLLHWCGLYDANNSSVDSISGGDAATGGDNDRLRTQEAEETQHHRFDSFWIIVFLVLSALETMALIVMIPMPSPFHSILLVTLLFTLWWPVRQLVRISITAAPIMYLIFV